MESRCEIDKYGNKRWYNAVGQFHREDGPAIEHPSGYSGWFLNGKRHREDGPAVERLKYLKLIESMIVYLVHNS